MKLVKGSDYRVTSKPWQKRQEHCNRRTLHDADPFRVWITLWVTLDWVHLEATARVSLRDRSKTRLDGQPR